MFKNCNRAWPHAYSPKRDDIRLPPELEAHPTLRGWVIRFLMLAGFAVIAVHLLEATCHA